MTTIETERLHIRPYVETDFPHVFRLQSDPEVMHYIRTAITDPAVVLERTQLWLQYATDNPGYGVWTLETRVGQEFVGYIVVRHVEFKAGNEIEIGYTLDKGSWGKGYATEATRAMIRYAMDTLQSGYLVAYTDENNGASNRILEVCGFLRKGMERMYDADCVRWEWRPADA